MAEKPMVDGTIRGREPIAVDVDNNVYEIYGFSASEPETMEISFDDPFDFPITLVWGDGDQQEETYDENMPGMTLDEFQAWSDQVIRDAKEDSVE